MIDLKERKAQRIAIKRLADLLEKIDQLRRGRIALDKRTLQFIAQLAQSDAIDTQHNAIEALHDQALEGYRARLLTSAPESLSHFVEYMTPDEPPAAHHEFMCQKLEAMARREVLRVLISMPPGHAKSKFCSRYFPAWYLGRRNNDKFIQAGHSGDFVKKEFGQVVRDIIGTESYRNVFPGVQVSHNSSAADYWSLAGFNGKYITKGVGQGIAGFRGNFAVLDDPYASRKDAESVAVRKEVYDWFNADLTTRLLPRCPILVVATRWHPLDLCGVLEQQTKDGVGDPWEVINLPAICEDTNDPLGRGLGDPLWPEFYDRESLLSFKSNLPARDWNSLYMGKPVVEDGGIVSADWFQRYVLLPRNETNDSGLVVKQNVRRITVSVDCASKATDRSDYTVATVWVEDMTNRHHLAHVYRERVEFNKMVSDIEALARQWHATAILIEDKGSGTQFIQTRSGLAPAPIVPISVGTDSKAFRFDGVSPMFQAGEVVLPERAVWLPDLERELLTFPGAAHDDQVDSVSQYLAWARTGRRLGTQKLRGAAPAQAGAEERVTDAGIQKRALQGSRMKNLGVMRDPNREHASARIG